MSTDGMATKTTMHININRMNGHAVVETETITVSKRFANNLRELAYLLDDKRPLAEFLDEHCGWVLVNLVEEKANTVGEWCDLIGNIAPWETEAECQAFVDRVRPKFEETAIFEVFQDDEGTWDIAPDMSTGTRSGCIAGKDLNTKMRGGLSTGAS
jgi:hypothetical protein